MRVYTEDYDEYAMVCAACNGDVAAMKALYTSHVRILTAICSRYLSDPDDVKDVLQESFLKIFASLQTFRYRGPGSIRGWMTRITINETISFIRQNTRIDIVPLTEDISNLTDHSEPDMGGIPTEAIH
ncbi:MAG: RNA polymerase sigma factor, partial [Muribaculaceae bacterium]|nr:RNA polymerase sigma factor [Muribaculaceae bacterium]